MIQPFEEPRSPLDREQTLRLRGQLIAERTQLREMLGRLYSEATQGSPEGTGDTPARIHLADLGTETFEQSANLGLAEQASRMISEIDRALDRMDQGTYGACGSCGKAIPIDRLEAIPSALRCAGCQSRVEEGLDAP